jgi:hypothetical protein
MLLLILQLNRPLPGKRQMIKLFKMKKNNNGQVAMETVAAIIAVFIFLLGTVQIFVWFINVIVQRQQYYESTRALATSSAGNAGVYKWKPPILQIFRPQVGCFLAGTSITMADNTAKAIEQIKVGNQVLAFDVASKQFKKDTVAKIYKHTAASYLIINNHLKVTEEHPVYSNGKWVKIGKLKKGDKILNAKGIDESIISITKVTAKVSVYNLKIKTNHTYIADSIVVHNKPL